MELPILFEDEELLVINKPPGIVVNRAQSVKGETVQDWAEDKLQIRQINKSDKSTNEWDKEFIERAGIVHRIDKETSGILLIAKNPPAFQELQRQFKERIVKKTYLAIAHGKLVPDKGEIRAPVGRLPWNRERFGIVPEGREAVTRYKVLKLIEVSQRKLEMRNRSEKLEIRSIQSQTSHFNIQHLTSKQPTSFFSLVELYPETGRTHQIRVHLTYINHPIVGDFLYAGRKTARDDRTWASRVMLHAWKISFIHPKTGGLVALEAPIPDDMNSIINKSDK